MDLKVQSPAFSNNEPIPKKFTGDGADVSPGFAIRWEGGNANDFPDVKDGQILRLVFYSDFVIDVDKRPVDGSHIAGELPTGRGAPGDTFRSWFSLA